MGAMGYVHPPNILGECEWAVGCEASAGEDVVGFGLGRDSCWSFALMKIEDKIRKGAKLRRVELGKKLRASRGARVASKNARTSSFLQERAPLPPPTERLTKCGRKGYAVHIWGSWQASARRRGDKIARDFSSPFGRINRRIPAEKTLEWSIAHADTRCGLRSLLSPPSYKLPSFNRFVLRCCPRSLSLGQREHHRPPLPPTSADF